MHQHNLKKVMRPDRTINSDYDQTNFSVIPASGTVALSIQCAELVGHESRLAERSLQHLASLRDLRIAQCKLAALPHLPRGQGAGGAARTVPARPLLLGPVAAAGAGAVRPPEPRSPQPLPQQRQGCEGRGPGRGPVRPVQPRQPRPVPQPAPAGAGRRPPVRPRPPHQQPDLPGPRRSARWPPGHQDT